MKAGFDAIARCADIASPSPEGPEPTIRWTSYNAALDAYQGELLQKETYTQRFLEAMKRKTDYNCTKLTYLWGHLVLACTGAGSL